MKVELLVLVVVTLFLSCFVERRLACSRCFLKTITRGRVLLPQFPSHLPNLGVGRKSALRGEAFALIPPASQVSPSTLPTPCTLFDQDGSQGDTVEEADGEINDKNDDVESTLKEVMLKWIRWYRTTLSPIMPPNCRFFPSCSKYAIQSIEEYGPIKGGILTAWRLLRCNPFGGSGYDPPEWPPPNYFRKNYQPPIT